jgi:lipoprotein-anchoring transpeptidase ErfK/SrfK
MALAVQAQAQNTANQGSPVQPPAPQATRRVIVVSLEDRKLALVEDGQVKKIYTVDVGKPSTPSPVGTFTIERRVANPTYHHDGKTVLPGPGNPVGTRWMGLSKHGYGIHGTNEPRSIGKAASHGCIRMARADLEELYPLVAEGDTVELVGQRNEETAQLFGGTENPVSAPAATETATVANPTVREQVVPATGANSTEKANPTGQALPTVVVLADLL